MALSFVEFDAVVEQETRQIGACEVPAGFSACSHCGIPLQETITGNRPGQDASYNCSDCYFETLGEELDVHPLGASRPVRGT